MSKKIGLIGLSVLLGASLYIPSKAQAQMVVACPTCDVVQGVANAELGVLNGTSAAMATQLTTTHTYLSTGVTGGPGGMIALLSNINAKLGKSNMAENQTVENTDMANRQLIYDQKMMEIRTAKVATLSSLEDACVQATASAGRSGGSRSTRAKTNEYTKKSGERFDDDRPSIQALIDTVEKRGELGVCSANDVATGQPGCIGQGAGDRPNADVEATSLFNGGDERSAGGTLDEKGVKIGLTYVSKILPNPPEKLKTDGARKSQSGIIYMMNYDKFVARLSAYKIAMTQQMAFRTPMEGNLFVDTWGEYKGEYEKMLGTGTFPAKPSEFDLIRFEALRDYQGEEARAKESTMSEVEALKKIVEQQALGNRLQLAILERLETQNIILSANGAQAMEPLTSGALEAQYNKASTSKDQ